MLISGSYLVSSLAPSVFDELFSYCIHVCVCIDPQTILLEYNFGVDVISFSTTRGLFVKKNLKWPYIANTLS